MPVLAVHPTSIHRSSRDERGKVDCLIQEGDCVISFVGKGAQSRLYALNAVRISSTALNSIPENSHLCPTRTPVSVHAKTLRISFGAF